MPKVEKELKGKAQRYMPQENTFKSREKGMKAFRFYPPCHATSGCGVQCLLLSRYEL